MDRKDELPKSNDRDGDLIPDDADVAETIKDVADMFKGRGKTPPVPAPPSTDER